MTAPRATYRLQLHPGFGFDDAAAVARLPRRPRRVATSTCRPYLQAAPGSRPTATTSSTTPGRATSSAAPPATPGWCAALRRRGAGPGARHRPQPHGDRRPREPRGGGTCSRTGRRRRYAGALRRRLGPARGEAAQHGAPADPRRPLRPGARRGRARGRAGRRRGSSSATSTTCCPVAPRSLGGLLAGRRGPRRRRRARLRGRAPTGACRRRRAPTRPTVAERHRDKAGPAAPARPAARRAPRRRRAAVDAAVADLNADADALDALLERQNYRLAYWRTAGQELDYRRFFDINTLVGLRVEDAEVFADTHELVLRLGAPTGVVDGLRVDHPDGLRDPEQYVERLARAHGRRVDRGREDPRAGRGAARRRGRSPAPPATTASTSSAGLFVDPAGEARLTEGYGRLTGADTDVAAVVRADARARRSNELLAADVNRLDRPAGRRVRAPPPPPRPHPPRAARGAVRGCSSPSPCTAPTSGPRRAPCGARTRRRWRGRRGRAWPRSGPTSTPTCSASWPTSCSLRLPDRTPSRTSGSCGSSSSPARRWPRASRTPPSTASTRLLALNEVGGDPGPVRRAGRRVPRGQRRGATSGGPRRWPRCRPTTPSGRRDVRARLALLSEIPPSLGGRRAAGGSRRRAATGPAARPDRHTRVPAVPDAGRRLAARRPSGRRPTSRRRRGRPRCTRRGPTPDAGLRRGAATASWPACSATAALLGRRRARSSARSSSPGGSTRWRRRCCSSPRPACPTSTRAPSCGTSAWSTPTTAARSTSTLRRALLAEVGRRRSTPPRPRWPSPTTGLPEAVAGARGAAPAPAAARGVRAGRGGGVRARCRSPGRPPPTPWASRAVAPRRSGRRWRWSSPRLVLGLAAAAAGATPPCACPGRWADLLGPATWRPTRGAAVLADLGASRLAGRSS